MGTFLTREVAESLAEISGDEKPLVEVIQQVRDEVSVMAVKGHGYGDRNLSMVLAKLDEARMWAEEYGRAHGVLLLVDKRKYIEQLRATEPTETTDNGSLSPC